jgi:CRP-like cAMP-binding protein
MSEKKRTRILLVDGNTDLAGNYRRVLKEQEIDVVYVTNGVDAWEKLNSEEHIDALVTELDLPKKNGIDLIKELREKEQGKSVDEFLPILVITAAMDEFQKDIAMIDRLRILQKPFSPQSLIDEVKRVVESRTKIATIDKNKVAFKADDYIVNEGEMGKQMFWLISGTVAITKMTKSGDQVILGYVNPGEMIGEMAFLDNMERSASARAMSDCEVLPIPPSKFLDVLQEQPRWFKGLVRALSKRLRNANEQIARLTESHREDK